MAPAAEAFMDRVEPYCSMAYMTEQAAIASSDMPAPSCPKRRAHSSGSSELSNLWDPGTLSIPMMGIEFASAHVRKSATLE